MCLLDVQDLFPAGIGCDIAGGYLVVRGLLLDDIEIRRLAGTYVGMSVGGLAARLRARIDARIGLVGLLSGFALQALAYVLTIGGADPSDGSLERGLVAGGAAVVADLLVLSAWQVLKPCMLRRAVLRVSCVDAESRTVAELPFVGVLIPLGREAGFPLIEIDGAPESDEHYALRVFGATLHPGGEY
jgi:hypothetical protein